jgi:hypothetical protein
MFRTFLFLCLLHAIVSIMLHHLNCLTKICYYFTTMQTIVLKYLQVTDYQYENFLQNTDFNVIFVKNQIKFWTLIHKYIIYSLLMDW